MKKEKIEKRFGGGFNFYFANEELEEILVKHLRNNGEDIPEVVDIEYQENGYGVGGTLIVQRKGAGSEHISDDDIPF